MLVDGKEYRSIQLKPGEREVVRIIDQTFLPHEFRLVDLVTLEDFCRAISTMQVRGAGLIGATAAFGMVSAARQAPRQSFEADIADAAAQLCATRPTAANLAWAVSQVQTAIDTADGIDNKIEAAFEAAQAVLEGDAETSRRIGLHGLEIIRALAARKASGPLNILTHCNAGCLAFVDHGTATAPIYAAQAAGIDLHVWVDETRPRNQGAALTAWELAAQGVPHDLIVDNAGGHLMQHGLVDMVIVGADRVTRRGDVANKIGTYLKALAAHDNGIPFFVALPCSTFDFSMDDGLAEIPIEERDPHELSHVVGRLPSGELGEVLICPQQTSARNYGFDVTPARLITKLICEHGVCDAEPNSIATLLMKGA
jgi:methylthioribose-1-phosphate isomerase